MTNDRSTGPSLGANRLHVMLALAMLLGIVADAALVFSELPESMASSFGTGGAPRGWGSKASFFVMMGIAILSTLVPLLALPVLLDKTPKKYLNVPNREYWLAPERRGHALAWLRDAVGWMLLATLALLGVVQRLVYEANLGSGRLGPGFAVAMVVYTVFLAFWLVRVFRRYRVPSTPS